MQTKKLNDKILFLLGAGASYGHRECPPASDTPPLMKDFLAEAASDGNLNENDFPQLTSIIKLVGMSEDLATACKYLGGREIGFEDLLTFLAAIPSTGLQNLQDQAREKGDKIATRYYHGLLSDASFALDTTRFFIQTFMGKFCRNVPDDSSAYRMLANFIKRNLGNVVGILTLNYDTIFEHALESEGIPYDYNLTTAKLHCLPVLKPHGSINFRLPLTGLIQMVGFAGNWESYVKSQNSMLETFTLHGSKPEVEVYSPSYILQEDFFGGQEKVFSHIPVTVQPLVDKKYDQLDSYYHIWDKFREILTGVDTLIVIGCRMHPDETRLWSYLRQYLSRTTDIRIIVNSKTDFSEINDRFRREEFTHVYPLTTQGFYEYGSQYLSNNRPY